MRSRVKLQAVQAIALTVTLAASSLAQQPAPLGTCSSPAVAPNVEPQRRSLYLSMADGVRLAVDVFLPRDLPAGTRLPTILTATRYWRAVEGQPPGNPERFWLSRGYALVNADVRGTGASFGQWYYPWSPQ